MIFVIWNWSLYFDDWILFEADSLKFLLIDENIELNTAQ